VPKRKDTHRHNTEQVCCLGLLNFEVWQRVGAQEVWIGVGVGVGVWR